MIEKNADNDKRLAVGLNS